MRNIFPLALCIVATLGTTLAASSETILTFQKSVKEQSETSAHEVSIGVGGDYFYVSEDGVTRRYDFRGRRLITTQRDKKTYEDISLFPLIAYRDAEFRNRLMLRDTLGAGGVQYDWFDTFEL